MREKHAKEQKDLERKIKEKERSKPKCNVKIIRITHNSRGCKC